MYTHILYFCPVSLCHSYVINIDLFKLSQMKSPWGLGRMRRRMGELIFLASEENDIIGLTGDLLPLKQCHCLEWSQWICQLFNWTLIAINSNAHFPVKRGSTKVTIFHRTNTIIIEYKCNSFPFMYNLAKTFRLVPWLSTRKTWS